MSTTRCFSNHIRAYRLRVARCLNPARLDSKHIRRCSHKPRLPAFKTNHCAVIGYATLLAQCSNMFAGQGQTYPPDNIFGVQRVAMVYQAIHLRVFCFFSKMTGTHPQKSIGGLVFLSLYMCDHAFSKNWPKYKIETVFFFKPTHSIHIDKGLVLYIPQVVVLWNKISTILHKSQNYIMKLDLPHLTTSAYIEMIASRQAKILV